MGLGFFFPSRIAGNYVHGRGLFGGLGLGVFGFGVVGFRV